MSYKFNRTAWSLDEETKAIALFHAGASAYEIAEVIDRTSESVKKRLRTHNLRFNAPNRSQLAKDAMAGIPKSAFFSDKMKKTEAARASIMHLVDLKRAGHSPTRTEYYIPPDYSPRFISVSFYDGSAVGSSAAMCAVD